MSHDEEIRGARNRLFDAATAGVVLPPVLAHTVELLLMLTRPNKDGTSTCSYAQIEAARDLILVRTAATHGDPFTMGVRHGVQILAAELTGRYKAPQAARQVPA